MTYSTSEALLTWFEELNERAASPDNCPWVALGEDQPSEVYLWAQKGARLMEALVTTENSAQTIVHWITQGIVDPKNVAAALESYPVDFVFFADNGTDNSMLDVDSDVDSDDHLLGQLSYWWESVVGRAMVLTKSTCGLGDEDKKRFLSSSFGYFSGNASNGILPTGYPLLKELAEQEIWARETIAQVFFSAYSKAPTEWAWVFDDVLMRNPSIDFLKNAIDLVDPPITLIEYNKVYSAAENLSASQQDMYTGLQTHKENQTDNGRQQLLDLFAEGAPKLFELLHQCCETYKALWGSTPLQPDFIKFATEQQKYRTAQRDVIQEMIVQHNATIGAATPIPDDALWEQKLDSSP